MAKDIGQPQVLYSRPEPWVKDVLVMIVGTFAHAGSKLFLSHQLALWELCGVEGEVDVNNHCYEALDRFIKRQPAIQKALAANTWPRANW